MLRDTEITNMSTSRFDNFAELYRAAFAEDNPEIKQLLLADVQKALDRWAESEETASRPQAGPKPFTQKDPSFLYRVA
jgi:hypothetical protein